MADYSNPTGLPQDLLDLLGDPRQQVQGQMQQDRMQQSMPSLVQPTPAPQAPQVNAAVTGAASGFPDLSSMQSAPQPAPQRQPQQDTSDDSDDAEEAAKAPSVRDYLMKKYGFGPTNDQAALIAAQKQAGHARAQSLMGQGLDRLNSALSRGTVGTSPEFWKQLAANGQQGVTDIEQQRAGLQEGMKNEAAVGQLSQQQQAQDPASDYSKLVQRNYSGLMQKMGMRPEGIEAMSAAQIEEGLQNPLKLKASYDETMAKLAEAAAMKRAMLANKQDVQNTKYEVDSNKELNHNKEYTTAMAKVSKAPGLLDMISQATAGAGNGQANQLARQAIATELGVYISGGQRLHTQTVEAMGLNKGAFMTKLQQAMADASSGGLTPENAKFAHDFIEHEARASQEEANGIRGRMAGEFQSIHGHGPKWNNGGQPQQQQGQQSSQQHAHQPGDIVSYQGKQYKIGADGDSMEPL